MRYSAGRQNAPLTTNKPKVSSNGVGGILDVSHTPLVTTGATHRHTQVYFCTREMQQAGQCGCPTDLTAGEGLWIASRFVKWGHSICLNIEDVSPFSVEDGEGSVQYYGVNVTYEVRAQFAISLSKSGFRTGEHQIFRFFLMDAYGVFHRSATLASGGREMTASPTPSTMTLSATPRRSLSTLAPRSLQVRVLLSALAICAFRCMR